MGMLKTAAIEAKQPENKGTGAQSRNKILLLLQEP
jgi:hypothetical protein